MATRPQAVLFDSFQTLFSLDALVPKLQKVGLSGQQLSPWYARALRDTSAMAATDTYVPFADMAAAALKGLAAEFGTRLSDDQIATVMSGMRDLRPVDDVRPAFDKLRAAGVTVALYTQGSRDLARHLVDQGGLSAVVDDIVSCDDAAVFKPAARGYHAACAAVGHADVSTVALVAAHSWDCHGAKRAGLSTGWVRRQETSFHPLMAPPDVKGDHLVQVVNRLLAI